jgi:hypothetical protein
MALTGNAGVPECQFVNLTAFADPEFFERPPETVRRVRGQFALKTTNPGAGRADAIVGLGLGVAPQEAVAAGSLPCPVTEAFWDGWMWHAFIPMMLVPAATPAIFAGVQQPWGHIDGRGQRKLEDNCLFWAAQVFVSASSTATDNTEVLIHAGLRWLLSPTTR